MRLMDKYPHFRKNTHLYIRPGEYNLYQVEFNNILESMKVKIILNEDAFQIIKLFDGSRKLSEIINILDVQSKNDVKKIIKFIYALTEKIEIIFSEKKNLSNLEIYGDSKTYLPGVVSLSVTNKCNYKCNYCYNSSSPIKNNFLDEPIIVLEQLKKMGVKIIELTGGEPLLHPEITKIIEYALLNFQILSLLTNGYHLNNEIL
jgi:2-iminoacetate synthase ThiH